MRELFSESTVWGSVLTIAAYGLGTLLYRKVRKAWCNPLLLAVLAVILILSVLQLPYADYKQSASPVSYLLLPATVSLAVPLYEKWELLKKNAAAIGFGILVGVITSLFSILLIGLLLNLQRDQIATLLPKSVTTAIGMDVAGQLGGLVPLASAVIVLTGIVGNLCAEGVCRLFRITDPVAKGVGIGTASHAIGTAKAFEMGEIEGAMSSLSIAAAGILTAVLAPVLLQLAVR